MAGSQAGMCARCLLAAALRHPPGSGVLGLPEPGDWIGNYRVVRLLGEGGMGMVYLAEQEQPIARQVAVKIIKLGMDTRAVLARFQSEQQALALMEHPNIAQVYEAGSSANGRPYFVMEYVPGVPITEYCDRNHLGTTPAAGVVSAGASGHAARAPERGGSSRPEAFQHPGDGARRRRRYRRSSISAWPKRPRRRTPRRRVYRGRGNGGDSRVHEPGAGARRAASMWIPAPTSIRWGCCCTSCWWARCLSIRNTCGAKDTTRSGAIIREDEPPAPASRLDSLGPGAAKIAVCRDTDAGGLRKQVRGDLDWITMTAMAKDRDRRYASASEMAADIVRHLRDEPVMASPPSASYRLRKFVRKHRGPVMALAAVFASLVLGLSASTVLYFRAERQRQEAEVQRAEADGSG